MVTAGFGAFEAQLGDLSTAVDEIANSWRPDDEAYRADIHRQILMMLSYGYFAYFHADPEHPDWAPLWNPVYTLQPNPDDIYLYAPVRGDLSYRVSGNRGTTALLTFSTQRGLAGMVDGMDGFKGFNEVDARHLAIADDGTFEILFSATRPPDHAGNWGMLDPAADAMMVRFRSLDWAGERNPDIAIQCLDPVPPKARLAPGEIDARVRLMAKMPGRAMRLFYGIQNGVRERVGVNVFEPVRMEGALSRQVYLPAVFELAAGEALILETAIPETAPYWNFQLNDPYYNAVEFVYRQSSLNAHQARLDADGRFRAVIALEDPGVPNWLDPAGFAEGTIYGRWYDCDSAPTPTLTRVRLDKVRDLLPPDTPVIIPAERAIALAGRVRAAQLRRRW